MIPCAWWSRRCFSTPEYLPAGHSYAHRMLRLLATLIIVPGLLLSGRGATAGESWVSEYPRVAARAEQDCASPG